MYSGSLLVIKGIACKVILFSDQNKVLQYISVFIRMLKFIVLTVFYLKFRPVEN